MKKNVVICLVFVLIVAVMTGCDSFQATSEEDEIQNWSDDNIHEEFENWTDGVVYDDLSDRFTITVYPTKIITEVGKKNIVYSMTVVNKSEEAYKSFILTIAMNEKLDPYIEAGVFPFPSTNFDMAAKSDPSKDIGKGADIEFQQSLSDEQFMAEAGIKYEDILELGKSFELWLQWDGGEEKYQLSADVIDETATSGDK